MISTPTSSEILQSLRLATGEKVVIRGDNKLLCPERLPTLVLLPEALAQIRGDMADDNGYITRNVRFDSPVGMTPLVETTYDDIIVFAKRVDSRGDPRSGLSRFVKGRVPESCNGLSLVIRALSHQRDTFVIFKAYCADRIIRERWDKRVRREDYEYWDDHAWVYGAVKIIPNSEQQILPEWYTH